jgi:hypothetical protein
MRDPNPSRFDPAFAVLDRVVDQDVATLSMHPFFARLTAADLDLGAEIFAHPSALVGGRLGDILWNASQDDWLIALYPSPKKLQVRHGRNVEVKVFDLAHGGPVDVVLYGLQPKTAWWCSAKSARTPSMSTKRFMAAAFLWVCDCPEALRRAPSRAFARLCQPHDNVAVALTRLPHGAEPIDIFRV